MSVAEFPEFSPELSLAVACARWPLDEAGRDELRHRAAAVQDWNRFLAWVGRQRIGPLVCQNLTDAQGPSVPTQIVDRLRADTAENTRKVLLQIADAARVTRALAGAGIRSLLLKGPVLSALIFGQPFMRENRDIDLLVHPDRASEADRIIGAARFRRFSPDFELTDRQSEIYRRYRCEFGYSSDATDVVCELHWRFSSNATLLPLERMSVWEMARTVRIGGLDFETVSSEEMFLYLCIHGSVHVWFRLKWLADIAALLNQMSAESIGQVSRRARELGVHRPFRQALLLAQGLLAARVPQDVLAEARQDRVVRRMTRAACHAINWNDSPGEPADTPWFNAWLGWQAYDLKPGMRYRWAELMDQISAPEDWARIPLPDWLHFLYPPIRPLSWLARKLLASLR